MAGKFPEAQMYLIYGNNSVAVNNARYELVCQLLTPEERDSGLTEVTGPGSQKLTLQRGLSEIIGELGTSSFLADSKRVVVVYDLKELFGGTAPPKKKAAAATKKKKPAASTANLEDALIDWLKNTLPTTQNIVVFVCNENDEKQNVLTGHSPLHQFLKRNGQTFEFRDKPLQFEFDNYLLRGNTAGAVSLFRDWQKKAGSDPGARMKMFSTLSNFVELVFQARCSQEARRERVPESAVAVTSGRTLLSRAPDFKQRSINQLAQKLPLHALQRIIKDLNKLQRLMYPSGDENYISAWDDMFESIIVEVTGMRWDD